MCVVRQGQCLLFTSCSSSSDSNNSDTDSDRGSDSERGSSSNNSSDSSNNTVAVTVSVLTAPVVVVAAYGISDVLLVFCLNRLCVRTVMCIPLSFEQYLFVPYSL